MTETEKKEFKDTLNLPKTTLDMRANATKKEPETQKFWEEQNIYKKMTEKIFGHCYLTLSFEFFIIMLKEFSGCHLRNIFFLQTSFG